MEGGAVVEEGEVGGLQFGMVGEGDEVVTVGPGGDQAAFDLPGFGDAGELLGLGREGVRITLREMSETKVVID